jgi:signal transduction histidine kinase
VFGNALHLGRAILNLTDNAVRYPAAGSSIEVSVARAGEFGLVRVRDRGWGIPAADLQHIFQPCYRAEPARACDTGGPGLGLAIVEQALHTHVDRVEEVSTIDEGSTFDSYVPLAPGSIPGQPPGWRAFTVPIAPLARSA